MEEAKLPDDLMEVTPEPAEMGTKVGVAYWCSGTPASDAHDLGLTDVRDSRNFENELVPLTVDPLPSSATVSVGEADAVATAGIPYIPSEETDDDASPCFSGMDSSHLA